MLKKGDIRGFYSKHKSQVNQDLEKTIIEWSQTHPKEMNLIGRIINRKSGGLSLRKIDYFITVYSQRYTVLIRNPLCPHDKIDIYSAYKDVLKCFHKNYFDPFCRISKSQSAGSKKIPLPNTNFLKAENVKNPALCQVNFFRWAFSMGIIKLAYKHSAKISEDMLRSKYSPESPSISSPSSSSNGITNSSNSSSSDIVSLSSSSLKSISEDENHQDELII